MSKRRLVDEENGLEKEPTSPPPKRRSTDETALSVTENNGIHQTVGQCEMVSTSSVSDSTPPATAGEYTFLGPSSAPTLDDRRGPRSRASHPVPVPNLTKKSRGRRVPTKSVRDKDGVQKASRLYVCKVEDCGKCFNRGEHLKRHTRSIHTHEKRVSVLFYVVSRTDLSLW